MNVADWNNRYADVANVSMTPSQTLERALAAWTLPPGDAMDLACGAGRHAVLMASRGWSVTAVDASRAALDIVGQHRNPLIKLILADLEASPSPISPDCYDLICDFYYLQRDLFPAIAAGIRPGGLFVGEIPMIDSRPGVPAMNRAFLLDSGEFRMNFEGWDLLEDAERIPADTERSGHRRKVATLIARKPLRQ